MKYRNPVKWSVTHYIRPKNKKVRKSEPQKTPKRSVFVKFLNSLQNRGPLHAVRGPVWEKFTAEVRQGMEEAGTWPQGMQDATPQIIAEYVSRLQKAFWNDIDFDKWTNHRKTQDLFSGEKHEHILERRRVFRWVYEKIRRWGMRHQYAYLLDKWFSHHIPGTIAQTWVRWDFDPHDRSHIYKVSRQGICITPFKGVISPPISRRVIHLDVSEKSRDF